MPGARGPAGAALALLAAATLVWPLRPALLVQADPGPVVALLPLRPGELAGIRFLHSVDRLPVEDWYGVASGRLVQRETRVLSFGAGMGHLAGEGRGVEEGAWLRVVDMDRDVGVLRLRVGGPEVGHTLLYRESPLALAEAWAGQRLLIRAVRLPRGLWAALGWWGGYRRTR